MKGRYKMRHHSPITTYQILKAVKVFGEVTREQLAMYFTGNPKKRIKALEQLLPELEREGILVVSVLNGKKVYFLNRKNKREPVSLAHEVGRSEIHIRLWRCRMDECEILPENSFRSFKVIPDGGLLFSEARGTMLVFENTTKKNFEHGVVKGKLTRYVKFLPEMEKKFFRDITVLFVIDIERERVLGFVKRMKRLLDRPIVSGFSLTPRYPFFFTDFRTFTAVEIGKALVAPIYFWHDGSEWALTHEH